jgi:hypothetical protein
MSASASLKPSATKIFDYRRCVLPSANGDRGRMSYERSDEEAVIGGHSIPTQAPRQFHYRSLRISSAT